MLTTKRYLRYSFLLLIAITLGIALGSCNKRVATTTDKKKAYKRKYKCKMCHNTIDHIYEFPSLAPNCWELSYNPENPHTSVNTVIYSEQ